MGLSDPIADLLTRIRNASKAKHKFIDMAHSQMNEAIVKVLKEQGFVAQFLVKEENRKKMMRIFIRYSVGREPVINALKRVSKPSLRRYVSCKQIPRVLGGMGISILSTPKGVLDGEKARELNVGGELICLAW